MNVKHFKNGVETKVLLNGFQKEKLLSLLHKLIENIDDEARLVVDSERLLETKKIDDVLEIIFDKIIKFSSKKFKNYAIKKVFIAVSGDLFSTENENAVVIFLGDKDYDSNPYINSNGAKILKSILTNIK